MNTADPDFSYLRKLWALRTVVESGSLKRASIVQKVSVSAVSQNMTALEKTLNRKLFVKKDRRLVPTQYCLELLSVVEPAFDAFEAIQNFQSQVCVPKMAWLNFGISQCIAGELLPRLVKRLLYQLPHLKLTLKVGYCSDLTAAVKRGDLCMALVTGNEPIKGASDYPLYSDRLGLYQARTLPLNGDVQSIAGLSANRSGHPTYYTRFLRSLKSSPRIALTCDNYESLYNIAVAGIMPVILPERLAAKHAGLLIELTQATGPVSKSAVSFTVRMVSESTCDPSEDLFLINELKSLI